ncbi:MAG: excinuclease ABC subunit UvrA [Bacteroidales bacterium]|nr:excinuclease ABC subunit UvrA [Bacteroidales bacterium]
MAADKFIKIRGARAHNLQGIDVDIPRDSFTVITGISGSGKSSLAFDTIYAEGQRRYMNTLSPYAKHFMGVMDKPQVESIEGLSPIIAIEQKTTGNNPRSTVGTITEISDFLRLLYARASTAYSPVTGKELVRYTDDQIVDLIMKEYAGRKCLLLAPLVRGRKGHYRELFDSLRRKGYAQVRIDGQIQPLNDVDALDRYSAHFVELVVDKLKPGSGDEKRVRDSVMVALGVGKGSVAILDAEDNSLRHFSKHLVDPDSGLSLQEPAPHTFSFNSPEGYCPHCKGLGQVVDVNIDSIIPDRNLSLAEGGLKPLGKVRENKRFELVRAIARKYDFSLYDPIAALPDEVVSLLIYGSDEFFRVGEGTLSQMVNWPGIVDDIDDRVVCPVCHGTRLKEETNCFRIDGKTIAEVNAMEISELYDWLGSLSGKLGKRSSAIARDILKELRDRVGFLVDVGLEYLTLDRATGSLSGGEGQRIRLATQIGSRLVNVIYILDEPSIGLHQRDNIKLLHSLQELRDEGNTVIVVEHDEATMRAADWLVDVGPGAGSLGGQIVYAGPTSFAGGENSPVGSSAFGLTPPPASAGGPPATDPRVIRPSGGDLSALQTPSHVGPSNVIADPSAVVADLDRQSPASATLRYLSGADSIPVPASRRRGNGLTLGIRGARGNNLKAVDVDFPLGCIIGVAGVSGSGKSSLINETLVPALRAKLYRSTAKPLPFKELVGAGNIDKVIDVDQSPIGRSPRSNPATFTGVFDDIRALFEDTPDAKVRGFKAGRFSFNVPGGRCEECKGAGLKLIEMNFLPSVTAPCEACGGKRYKEDTLAVHYKGKNINDVLEMPIEQAYEFFRTNPRIAPKLKALVDVGLGYVHLGQSSVTLSGGESQRMKLAAELFRKSTGNTLYILDEPTTGLHFEDIKTLLGVLGQLADQGNTIIIIEHNLDVLKCVDWLIDMGPEGGRAGGRIVASGTPEDLALDALSVTGPYLKSVL